MLLFFKYVYIGLYSRTILYKPQNWRYKNTLKQYLFRPFKCAGESISEAGAGRRKSSVPGKCGYVNRNFSWVNESHPENRREEKSFYRFHQQPAHP